MDLYAATALHNAHRRELLAEAEAARLAAQIKPNGLGDRVRSAGGRLAAVISEARGARVVRHVPHKAASHS